MEIFQINSNLSTGTTVALLAFLDEVCVEIRAFIQNNRLPLASQEAVNSCWVALKYLILHTTTEDRGISPNFYDKQRESLDLLDDIQKALFWSFMFRGTEYMLKKIKSPQYVSNSSYVEVKKQLLEWNKFAQQQYQPFRYIVKSLKRVDVQSYSYTEPGPFVPNLSQS